MENLHGRKKLTMGRRKIEMKKIQKKASLLVTFTKRRTWLFKKASELCILCGSELSIIVQSPAKKFYAFHSPSVESMRHRFDIGDGFITDYTSYIDDARTEYEEAVRMLEEKKKEVIVTAMNREIKEREFWWDQQIDGMDLQQLEGYLESLETLKKNIACRIEEMEKLPKKYMIELE
ncbi:agamous-like MADS-box protein AGL62 [Primulina huaijiensis]|uniref:agamous-like MADS-box protein AGL62 n=1 Tax=Primulina huaijiensis TaxID=1492673 RepID=UPI003CC6DE02